MANLTTAVVGRPNVDKSAIFNHIAGEHISTVEGAPGVTRDRIYVGGEQLDREFSVIDMGGIDLGDEPFMGQVRHQAEITVEEADVIICVVNGRKGVASVDETVTKILYRSNKPMILAVNKVDDPKTRNDIYEFYSLGLDDPYPVSGNHGLGIGDILDEAVRYFSEETEERDGDTIEFGLIGHLSVGRSSLISAILREGRVIISDIGGTTRNAIDTHFVSKSGQKFLMIDTASMHKRGEVYKNTERYNMMRVMRVIDRSDIVLMVLNAEEGIREQGKRVVGYTRGAGRGAIIVVNKWDPVKKETSTMRGFEQEIRDGFRYLDYAPTVFVSAVTKQRLERLPEMIEQVGMNQSLRISSTVLNDIIMDAVAVNPTPTDKRRRLKIFYATQVAVRPLTFVVFINEEELMRFSYERFLENQIRKAFTFEGASIQIIPRRGK